MSDPNLTPETPASPAAPAPASAPSGGEAEILSKKLAEVNARLGEQAQQLAAVLRERDTFKESLAKLEPVAKEADKLRLQVEGYQNTAKESAILERLRAQLPGAEVLAIKGVLSSLHEAGKVNRYSDDASAEAEKILNVIKQEAPSLTRTPTGAGGTAAVRETPAPVRPKSFVRG